MRCSQNLSSVIDWCAINDHYEDGRDIGLNLAYYLYLYGHWDRGMTNLSWMIESAERREDWLTVVELRTRSGWILVLMGQLEYAEKQLLCGWELSVDYGGAYIRCFIADCMAILNIRKGCSKKPIDGLRFVSRSLQNLKSQIAHASRYMFLSRGQISFIKNKSILKRRSFINQD